MENKQPINQLTPITQPIYPPINQPIDQQPPINQPPPPYQASDYPNGQLEQQPPQIIQYTYPAQPVGPEPAALVCRMCQRHIVTRISYESSTRTHLMAALLCACLCWPCVCLPYCIDSCKAANHYCPNCNAFIGTYKH